MVVSKVVVGVVVGRDGGWGVNKLMYVWMVEERGY